jgi:hypothetical protein
MASICGRTPVGTLNPKISCGVLDPTAFRSDGGPSIAQRRTAGSGGKVFFPRPTTRACPAAAPSAAGGARTPRPIARAGNCCSLVRELPAGYAEARHRNSSASAIGGPPFPASTGRRVVGGAFVHGGTMTLSRRGALHLATCSIALPAMARVASAQAYPARTVTIVIPFAPGGVTDFLGRLIAQQLSQRWGRQFIIENKAGAGGNTGAAQAGRSAPDGYTLAWITVSSHAINPSLYRSRPENRRAGKALPPQRQPPNWEQAPLSACCPTTRFRENMSWRA